MKTWVLFAFGVIVLFVTFMIFNKKENTTTNSNESITVEIKGQKYALEVADTNKKREVGLMNRKELPKDSGMIFIFNTNGFYPFWMKNTLIPLDIIWLNDKKEVVYIYENAKPCSNAISALCNSMIPTKLAKYVIELNAGEAKKINLKVGDSVNL